MGTRVQIGAFLFALPAVGAAFARRRRRARLHWAGVALVIDEHQVRVLQTISHRRCRGTPDKLGERLLQAARRISNLNLGVGGSLYLVSLFPDGIIFRQRERLRMPKKKHRYNRLRRGAARFPQELSQLWTLV